jgi:hypothetical protein
MTFVAFLGSREVQTQKEVAGRVALAERRVQTEKKGLLSAIRKP